MAARVVPIRLAGRPAIAKINHSAKLRLHVEILHPTITPKIFMRPLHP
jgi:hypothetical protein